MALNRELAVSPELFLSRLLLLQDLHIGWRFQTSSVPPFLFGIAQNDTLNEESRRVAVNALTLYNIKLVVSIARRYIAYANGLSMDDLVEDGILGLMRSIEQFPVFVLLCFSFGITHV